MKEKVRTYEVKVPQMADRKIPDWERRIPYDDGKRQKDYREGFKSPKKK